MENCIFCKIINGEIPSFKIYENSNTLAFLDINPNTKGVTLVTPKKHTGSNIISTDDNLYIQTLKDAREVANILSNKLKVERVGLVIEGVGVDHLHIKLYPFHAEKKPSHNNMEESAIRVFNETYQGYMTTQLGPQADFEELKKLSEEIKE